MFVYKYTPHVSYAALQILKLLERLKKKKYRYIK